MKKKEFFESAFWFDFGKPFSIWACLVGGIAAVVGISYLIFG